MGDKFETSRPKSLDSQLLKEVIGRHGVEFKPSMEFLERQNKIHQRAIERDLQEKQVIRGERKDLLALRVRMAVMPDGAKVSTEESGVEKSGKEKSDKPEQKEASYLNIEEQKVYTETIDECLNDQASTPEDKEALRDTMMNVLFKKDVFKIHYQQWKNEWTQDPKLQSKFPELSDYVMDSAKKFIRTCRNELVSGRLRKFQKDALPKKATDAQQEAKLAEINDKTLKFLEQHEKELLECSILDEADPKRVQLFQKFVVDCGLGGAKTAQARELFNEVLNDMQVAYLAEEKFAVRKNAMIRLTEKSLKDGKDVSDGEWDQMLQAELEKDEYFKEMMKQQQVVTQTEAEVVSAPKTPLENPQAVAKLAGDLQITGYDAKTGIYTLRYPNTNITTEMKIIPVPGAKTLDEAKFVFVDKHADKDKGNEIVLDRKNLRAGCNQILLDYFLTDWVRKNKVSPDFDANNILRDNMMRRMAERLFAQNLNDMTLTKPMQMMFTRFIQIVLRDDGGARYGNLAAFSERVKKMDTVLMNPAYAGAIFRELKHLDSANFTVSNLLEKIGYKGI